MERAIKMRLDELTSGRVRFEEPLAPLTTFGLGGPAAALLEPESIAELKAVLGYVNRTGLPFVFLGAGSNVLFREGGFPGLVIRFGEAFSEIRIIDSGREGFISVEAGAGAPLSRLMDFTKDNGLSGLEFLSGIPGSVGGAMCMNAGAFGGEITKCAVKLTLIAPWGDIDELGPDRIRAEYRRLQLPEGAVILSAVFSLTQSTTETVKEKCRDYLNRRWAIQPTGIKSAGSVFKNPPDGPAGKFIDEAGLKGRRVGEAWVSEKHANFIIHKGQAKASDVIELISIVQKEVKTRFGIDLEPEIRIYGQDTEENET
jgi:UDP-N-acetylmuramate dehydrogenase